MELFKITCVTCRARLSVRDARTIGTIVACPRCGSMVQVIAPAGWTTAEAAAPVAPPLLNSPRPATPAANTALAEHVLFEPETLSAHEGGAMDAPVPTEPATTTPASAHAEPRGWWGMKLATIVAGAAIGGAAAVGGMMTWLQQNEPPSVLASATTGVVASDAAAEATTQADGELDDVAAAAPAEGLPLVSDVAAADPASGMASAEQMNSAAVAPTPLDEAPHAKPTSPIETESPRVASIDPTPAAKAPAEPAAADSKEAKPPVEQPRRLTIDPLVVDPEGLDLTTLLEGPVREPAIADVVESAPTSVVEPQGREDAGGAFPIAAPEGNAIETAPPDIDALLARKYPKIAIEKMPLCRLLDFVTRLSGLPVSVSPAELRVAGVGAATPISASVERATIEKFLAEALASVRLAPRAGGGQVVLERVGGDPVRTIEYPIDDLVPTAAGAPKLAGWLRELVFLDDGRGGAATIELAGPKLRITAPQSLQYEALVLIERYRLARGLVQRSKYPAALVAPVAANPALRERMAGPATFTFAAPTPLREIFRYWQEECGVAVLVDWPALATERLWPQSPVRLSAAGKPWNKAFDETLAPLGLAWRPVGPRAIQITTSAIVDEEPAVEIYEVGVKGIEEAQRPAASLDRAIVVVDEEYGVLMVRASAAAQRELVEKLVAAQLLRANATVNSAP